MIPLAIFFTLNFAMFFLLQETGDGLVHNLAVSLIFSFLATGLLARFKLYYYILRSLNIKKEKLIDKILLPLTSFYFFPLAMFGTDIIKYWWLGLLSIAVMGFSKGDEAWKFRGGFKIYNGYEDFNRIPMKVLDRELVVVQIFLFSPIPLLIYVKLMNGLGFG